VVAFTSIHPTDGLPAFFFGLSSSLGSSEMSSLKLKTMLTILLIYMIIAAIIFIVMIIDDGGFLNWWMYLIFAMIWPVLVYVYIDMKYIKREI
jgi:uncharacterized membrane protein